MDQQRADKIIADYAREHNEDILHAAYNLIKIDDSITQDQRDAINQFIIHPDKAGC